MVLSSADGVRASCLSFPPPPTEFGVKLGSQIYIKHITDSGLAARHRGLQEGDLILQVTLASHPVGRRLRLGWAVPLRPPEPGLGHLGDS